MRRFALLTCTAALATAALAIVGGEGGAATAASRPSASGRGLRRAPRRGRHEPLPRQPDDRRGHARRRHRSPQGAPRHVRAALTRPGVRGDSSGRRARAGGRSRPALGSVRGPRSDQETRACRRGPVVRVRVRPRGLPDALERPGLGCLTGRRALGGCFAAPARRDGRVAHRGPAAAPSVYALDDEGALVEFYASPRSRPGADTRPASGERARSIAGAADSVAAHAFRAFALSWSGRVYPVDRSVARPDPNVAQARRTSTSTTRAAGTASPPSLPEDPCFT